MDLKAAYKVMQEHCGIEDRDEVKLLRTYKTYEMGCDLHSLDKRKVIVGGHYFADLTNICNGIKLRDKPNGKCVGFAPFFCLELVEKAKPEPPPIYVDDHEVEFLDGKIRVCDVTVSKETLKQIYERLEN